MAKRNAVKPTNPITETPLDNRIILLEDAAPEVRESGIILAGQAGGVVIAGGVKPYTGTVLAVGPEVKGLKVMDKVRYSQRGGEKIIIDLEEYLMVRETDIYTKLK